MESSHAFVGYLKKEKPSIKRSTKSLQVVAYSDSNYATDVDNIKSMSGYVVTLGGPARSSPM